MSIAQVTNVGTSNETILTVPVGKTYGITALIFCNQTVSDTTLGVNLAGNGTPGTDNLILFSQSIPAGETLVFETERFSLQAGGVVSMKVGNAGTINATVSYVQL